MRAPRRPSGFTLVEILVAMTLLSLVMLALGAAMRTLGQTEQRVDQRLQAADEMRVASQFLASVLGRVSPRKSTLPAQAGASPYLFAGDPAAVAWVGVMPARHGAGGRHYFRLGGETVDGHPVVVLRYAPWTADTGFPDWSAAQSRVLAAGVAGFALAYADGAGNWSPAWRQPDKLPARIRVDLRTAAGEWPPLIVAMRQLPAAGRGDGTFTVGAD